MLSKIRITDALPADKNIFVVNPSDFKDVPFTSALLLPHSFDPSIVDHAKFFPACEAGFETYFEEMWDGDSFVDHVCTWQEVKTQSILNVFPDPMDIKLSALHGWEPASLAWRAGFLLGWLSALGLTDRPLALQGVALLSQLVTIQQSQSVYSQPLFSAYEVPFNPASHCPLSAPSSPHMHARRVGGDGFPLDL